MGNQRNSIVGSVLFLVLCLNSVVVLARPGDRPESALVIVLTRYPAGERGGNGFVIGDGTLVVTNDHLIHQVSDKGDHRMEGLVAVYSPYLGQACDARILATDEKLDLAVLEVPWKGHPAFRMADAPGVGLARVARVIGMPALARYVEDPAPGAIDPNAPRIDIEELEVLPAKAGEMIPSTLFLNGTGKLGPGWSGAPMCVPGTSEVIGCLCQVTRIPGPAETGILSANGPAIYHVSELLGSEVGPARLAAPAAAPLARPGDANEAFSLALHAAMCLRPGRYASALEPAQAFVALRPQSGLAHKMLANACEKQGQVDAARQSYERALELDPNSLHAQILFAQFLDERGDFDSAEQILVPLRRSGRAPDLVAIALVNHFGSQNQFDRCIEVVTDAVKLRPRNAYLWYQMAVSRMQIGGPGAMIEPLSRAVELLPEQAMWRGGLAQMLERTGDLDQAEMHFRKLPEIEPENPIGYVMLAQFLHKHRPNAAEEALEMARKALALPPNQGLRPAKIQALITKIQSQMPPG